MAGDLANLDARACNAVARRAIGEWINTTVLGKFMVMSQPWSADAYAEHAGYVPAFGTEVLALLDPRPGERILDLGCGDGVLSAQIAGAGARVIGVDSSVDMAAAARGRGLDARVMDAHALNFARAFAAVFSNAALHWMREPDRVIEGVRPALCPGGRFVGEMGVEAKVAAVRAALVQALAEHGIDATPLDPWYFPSSKEYQQRLERSGFIIDTIVLFPRPTVLPTGLDGWLDIFGATFLNAVPAPDRPRLRARVAELAAPLLRTADGSWRADYVRLRFRATTTEVCQARRGSPRRQSSADLSREKFHNVPFSGGGSPAYLEPDKLPDDLTGHRSGRCLSTRNSEENCT